MAVEPRRFGALGPLTDHQLQAAAARFDLGRVHTAEPLTGGLFGKNVALTTDTGPWVLRGDPWPDDRDDQFRRERCFARLIHDHCELTAPWPYLIDPDPSLFGWPYALMPRLAGAPIGKPSSNRDWPALAAGFGRAVADLHRIAFDTPGEWRPDTDRVEPIETSGARYLEARIAWWMFRTAETSEALDPASERMLTDAIEGAALELDLEDDAATYVHHDLNLGNVLASDDGTAIVAVFDLGEGYVADPLEDLPRLLTHLALHHGEPAVNAYLQAYSGASGRTLSRVRLRSYTLFDLLVFWEYGRRPAANWFPEARSFAEWVAPVLARVEDTITAW